MPAVMPCEIEGFLVQRRGDGAESARQGKADRLFYGQKSRFSARLLTAPYSPKTSTLR